MGVVLMDPFEVNVTRTGVSGDVLRNLCVPPLMTVANSCRDSLSHGVAMDGWWAAKRYP
jgi:hypothetical protein